MRLVALATASFLALGLGSCGKSEQQPTLSSFGPPANWAEREGFAGNKQAERGAEIFANVGCLSCHTYLGTGSPNMGAPDLSSIGRQNPRSAEAFATYVSDPSKFGNTVMPKFEGLGRTKLLALGAFLEASKGDR